MRLDADEDFLPGVFRLGGIEMLLIHIDLAVTICLQPFVSAHMETLWRQRKKSLLIPLKQPMEGTLFLVMELLCLLFVKHEELLAIFCDIRKVRNREKAPICEWSRPCAGRPGGIDLSQGSIVGFSMGIITWLYLNSINNSF